MDADFKIEKSKLTQLDAWPVVLSLLFDLAAASDDVVAIIERAGLSVDWNLTPKEAYSHSTRKRAYKPRVQTAYSNLPPNDRQTVVALIFAELARKYPNQAHTIKDALARIGWALKTVRDVQPRPDDQKLFMKRDKDLQKLLLLQVRDGEVPEQLRQYPEQQQVYNAALLINDGYVDGQAIPGGSGTYVSTVMTALTSKGHDFLEASEKPIGADTSTANTPKHSKLIFVSHSSADEDLAKALVDMLCTALHLRVNDFLCTSVDGAKLQGGDSTNDTLRSAIRDVPCFLSILTTKAVASTYVLFELGARWGCGKHHIPLLAKGAGSELLKEPLKGTNALRLSHEPDVLQLVMDISNVLKLTPEPPNSYHHKMVYLVETSVKGSASNKATDTGSSSWTKGISQLISNEAIPPITNPWLEGQSAILPKEKQPTNEPPGVVPIHPLPQALLGSDLSQPAKKLLVEASDSVDGFVSKLPSATYGEIVSVHTKNRDFLGKPDDNRARAQWVHAFNELVRAEYFEPTNKPGFYAVSHIGFQFADLLKQQGIK